MDALLKDLQVVCQQLLPILGAVVLVFLCLLLKKLGVLVDQFTTTIKELDPTIKKVDLSLQKVQAPLDTAVKYSHSLDKVHDKTSEVFSKAADFANENLEKLQTIVDDKVNDTTVSMSNKEQENSNE